MRVGQLQPARPAWYDRNPTQIIKNLSLGPIAPHATTTRWTYTVPANRKYAVGGGQISLQRNAAAGPVGLAFAAQAEFGGPYLHQAQVITNVVGDKDAVIIGASGGGHMLAGNGFFQDTSDASTGGTMFYFGSNWGIEYDA